MKTHMGLWKTFYIKSTLLNKIYTCNITLIKIPKTFFTDMIKYIKVYQHKSAKIVKVIPGKKRIVWKN